MRPIDADALARELLSLTWLGCDGDYFKGMSDERDATLQRIADAPTVDAAPVVRGEWLEESLCIRCSECYQGTEFATNYCPNCGAKLREGAGG